MTNKLIKQLSFILASLLLLTSISANAVVKVGAYFGNWSAKTTYGAGDFITYSDKTFLSLVAKNKNKNPNSTPKAWQLFGGPGNVGPQGIQGLAGLPGLPGAQGKSTGYLLLDANKNIIGNYDVTTHSVILEINGVIYPITGVSPNGFTNSYSGELKNYVSSDCSGNGYSSYYGDLTSEFPNIQTSSIVVNSFLTVIDKSRVTNVITFYSYLYNGYCYAATSYPDPLSYYYSKDTDVIQVQYLGYYRTPFSVIKE